MRIAVLSGKGGTGKTLVSVNLAAVSNESTYIDCDVEEPNGHIFFKPDIYKSYDIEVRIPTVDDNLCNGCRVCVDFCKFNALAYTNDKVIVFDDICHSCGGCSLLCPQAAIKEIDKKIGEIQIGKSENVTVLSGIMNTGEESGVPIINELLSLSEFEKDKTFIDCPPGSSCTVMESIKDADYCILVAEPTVFGMHNFKMVVELVKLFNKPFGVIINKCNGNFSTLDHFCKEHSIKILTRIPYDTKLGKLNSDGFIAVRHSGEYKNFFKELLSSVEKEVLYG